MRSLTATLYSSKPPSSIAPSMPGNGSVRCLNILLSDFTLSSKMEQPKSVNSNTALPKIIIIIITKN